MSLLSIMTCASSGKTGGKCLNVFFAAQKLQHLFCIICKSCHLSILLIRISFFFIIFVRITCIYILIYTFIYVKYFCVVFLNKILALFLCTLSNKLPRITGNHFLIYPGFSGSKNVSAGFRLPCEVLFRIYPTVSSRRVFREDPYKIYCFPDQ